MWNVQGLRRKITELEEYLCKFDIIALTETWMEQGIKITGPLSQFDWQWVPAMRRKERGRASGGQAIDIRKGVEHREFKCSKSGSWAGVEIKIDNNWIRIISIYNNTSIKAMKEELREQCTGCDYILIGGDLNARIGNLNGAGSERSTRDSSVNEEGERWMEFATAKGLQLLNGATEGDWNGEFTRIGYENQESSVLDYAFASSSINPLVRRFEIGTQAQSDHFPMEITINGSISGSQAEKRRIQLWGKEDILKFKQKLEEEANSTGWGKTKKRLLEATRSKIIPPNNETKNKWWNPSCKKKRDQLRLALSNLRTGSGSTEDYKQAKSEYKQEIKMAKEAQQRKFEEELSRVKTVAEGWTFINRIKKNKNSPAYKPPDEALIVHFETLLRGPVCNRAESTTSRIAAPHLSNEEFLIALSRLKAQKAQGPDGLKAEAIIHANHSTKQELRRQLNEILQGGEIPPEWGESLIWPIHKKGDPTLAKNYRGIAIGNAIHKLLAIVIQSRLQKIAEDMNMLPDSQNGFRRNRSTVDSLFIMNSCIQNEINKRNGRLLAFFVDFRTAFDTVNRNILWETLRKLQVPEHILVVLENMYGEVYYTVAGTKFQSHIGLKQGCPLSPLLFALYIHGLDNALKGNQLGGVMIGKRKLFSLAFADDLVILATSEEEMKDMIKAVHRYAKTKQLTINDDKSKILKFSKGSRKSKGKWTIEGRHYEEVEEFQYLGVTLQRNGKYTRHHKHTATKARRRAAEV